MQGCDNFKEITLRSCPDSFIITAATGLTADTEYCFELKNKFNRKIRVTETTDGDGKLIILDSELSKDQFHDFSGAYELRIYEGEELTTLKPFCDGSDYLVINFEEVDAPPEPNNAVIEITCP